MGLIASWGLITDKFDIFDSTFLENNDSGYCPSYTQIVNCQPSEINRYKLRVSKSKYLHNQLVEIGDIYYDSIASPTPPEVSTRFALYGYIDLQYDSLQDINYMTAEVTYKLRGQYYTVYPPVTINKQNGHFSLSFDLSDNAYDTLYSLDLYLTMKNGAINASYSSGSIALTNATNQDLGTIYMEVQ